MSLMKTRQIMVLTVLLGLWAAPDGLTFYNPETGRWPNRDPIRELGFEALRAHYARKGKPTRGDGTTSTSLLRIILYPSGTTSA